MVNRREIERRFLETDSRLNALTDRDPEAAIAAARNLAPDELLSQDAIDAIAAGTLVDAGVAAKDPDAVDEGVRLFERLLSAMPDRGDIEYCLANGLSAQSDFARDGTPAWFVTTQDARRRARYLYQSAGSRESTPRGIAAQAFTNLANSLLAAYRLVEAYDSYLKALDLDPTNGVALTGAARALLLLVHYGVGDSDVLPTVAARHLAKARENPDRIRELAGEQAFQQIRALLNTEVAVTTLPDLTAATEYQKWVARQRLSLAPTIEGLDLNLARWDSLLVGSIIEPTSAGPGAPPLFAMFNVLKSEFLTARFLAYTALREELPESGRYTDTLDYANYGVQSAGLTLAQRACIDLLDKIAVATSEYLELPGDPKRIYFSNRWFDPRRHGEPVRLQEGIQAEILEGNHALTAITEVAGDIGAGGFLNDKRALRHSSTHRFAVLHDLGGTPSRESKYVDHFELDSFVDQLLETLRLTRAVLLYFVEMVMIREHRQHENVDFLPSLALPDHDWVRGRDT